jgi:predicted metal-dependent hydrolase
MPEAGSLTKLSELELPAVPYRGRILQAKAIVTPFAHTRITLRDNVLQLALSAMEADKRVIANNLSAHVCNWLRSQARRAFCEDVETQKVQHGFTYQSVSIKDTRSRWGSCSARKNLNFNWRLIMAPDDVLSYVVTHETAHLSHLDHSIEFWKLVGERCPGYLHQKDWLRRNGASLMNWDFVVKTAR